MMQACGVADTPLRGQSCSVIGKQRGRGHTRAGHGRMATACSMIAQSQEAHALDDASYVTSGSLLEAPHQSVRRPHLYCWRELEIGERRRVAGGDVQEEHLRTAMRGKEPAGWG